MTQDVYFFYGNCQMHYLCSMAGAATSAKVYAVGAPYNVNVALDGAPVEFVGLPALESIIKDAAAKGGKAILLVQYTTTRRYMDSIQHWPVRFDHVVNVPVVGYQSPWPFRILGKDLADIKDAQIARLGDWEKHQFRQVLHRSGGSSTDLYDDYWERNRTELRFYHPGHPNGAAFADVLDAISGSAGPVLPFLAQTTAALRRSMGIFQASLHPISLRVGEKLNLEWAQSDLYRAWAPLRTPRRERRNLLAAIEAAEAILADPLKLGAVPWPSQAHFRVSLGKACINAGQYPRGLSLWEEAFVLLKGFPTLFDKAMMAAARTEQFQAVESLLVTGATYDDHQKLDRAKLTASLQIIASGAAGKAVLTDARARIAPSSWLHPRLEAAIRQAS